MFFSARGVFCLVEGKKLFDQFTRSVGKLSRLHHGALYNTALLHCIAQCISVHYRSTVQPMHTKLCGLGQHSAIVSYLSIDQTNVNTSEGGWISLVQYIFLCYRGKKRCGIASSYFHILADEGSDKLRLSSGLHKRLYCHGPTRQTHTTHSAATHILEKNKFLYFN